MRLFVAVDPPDVEVARVAALVSRMRASSPPAGWCRPDNLHVTLKFLGETEAERLEAISGALSVVAAATVPFDLSIGLPGAFPDLRRARVLWLSLDPAGPLVGLSLAVDAALAALGCPAEGRDPKPHLTVARIRDPWPGGAAERWSGKFGKEGAGKPFRVDRIRLVESHLAPGGARHDTLREFPLGRNLSDRS
jgi:2'-5' RNA ligase